MSTIPPGPRLTLPPVAVSSSAVTHVADLFGVALVPAVLEGGAGQGVQGGLDHPRGADHDPRLAQRLPLPELAVAFGK